MKRHVCSPETCGMRPEYDVKGAPRVDRAARLRKYGLRETVHAADGRRVTRYSQPAPTRDDASRAGRAR